MVVTVARNEGGSPVHTPRRATNDNWDKFLLSDGQWECCVVPFDLEPVIPVPCSATPCAGGIGCEGSPVEMRGWVEERDPIPLYDKFRPPSQVGAECLA